LIRLEEEVAEEDEELFEEQEEEPGEEELEAVATFIQAGKASMSAFIPAGAMPISHNGQLSKHAAEFWFPESKDCACCGGFKYGCACQNSGATECHCAGLIATNEVLLHFL
jgi:hypothetical protein